MAEDKSTEKSLTKLRFDLTTVENITQAADMIRAMETYGTPGTFAYDAYWRVRKALKSVAEKQMGLLEVQKYVAIDLIKAGKENDVDEMEITLDGTAGDALGTSVEGVPITRKLDDSGHTVVKVKFQ